MELTLCYSSEDSLNPYKAKTMVNLQLSTLLYDSLTLLDTQWQPAAVFGRLRHQRGFSAVSGDFTERRGIFRRLRRHGPGCSSLFQSSQSLFQLSGAAQQSAVLYR